MGTQISYILLRAGYFVGEICYWSECVFAIFVFVKCKIFSRKLNVKCLQQRIT